MRKATPPVRVPDGLAKNLLRFFGPAWLRELPELTAHQCELWGLRITGPAMHGVASLVLPVRTFEGARAVLKMQPVDEETEGEPAALRTWAGRGSVHLLEHDPDSGAMLLEALDPTRDLSEVALEEALTVVGSLLGRLSTHSAPAGMRALGPITLNLVTRAGKLGPRLRSSFERDRLADLAARARPLAEEPGARLLHWDLHFENVLAPRVGTDREPWVAIDPKPLAGDPGFDLLPCLHNRWREAVAAGDARRATRWRLDLLSEVAGMDRERARAWTLVRVLQECVWHVQDGATALPAKHVTIAEALGA